MQEVDDGWSISANDKDEKSPCTNQQKNIEKQELGIPVRIEPGAWNKDQLPAKGSICRR